MGTWPVNGDSVAGGVLKAMINDVGVAGVAIRAYLKTDYDLGRRTIRGETTSKDSGDWVADLRLNADTYVLEFAKQGVIDPYLMAITVSADGGVALA